MQLSPSVLRASSVVVGAAFCCFLLGYGVTQEVPMGQVNGKVLMAENGAALPEALITISPMSGADEEYGKPRYTYSSKDGAFSLRSIPAGTYELDISARHHNFKTQFVFVEEGKVTDLSSLKMQPVAPYLNLYASQRVFTPAEKPHLELHGFVKNEKVEVEIAKLNLEAVAEKGGLQDALYPLKESEKIDPKVADWIKSEEHKVQKRDVEGAFIDEVQVPKLEPGFYYVRCKANKISAATYLNITSIAMVTKSAQGKSLAFATELMSGKPVRTDVFSVEGRSLKRVGTTDANGLLQVNLPKDQKPLLIARRGRDVAMVGFYNNTDNSGQYTFFTYTERPIYRPGDEIHFKGVVRKAGGDSYSLPGSATVKVELRNNDGDTVETVDVPLSAHGTYYGTVRTASEAEPGDWSLRSTAFGQTSDQYVSVSAYRKPEYSVSVEGTKPYFILGQRASAKVKAEYYFGGPVIGAKVKAYVYRSPVWSYESDDGEDWGYDSFSGGEFSEEIEAVTDANGEALIEFDTRVEGDPDEYPTDFAYSIVANVADEGDKSFSGEGSVSVVRGAYELGVETNRYVVDEGQDFEITVSTTSHENESIPGRPVEITVGREEWTRRTSIFIPVDKKQVTTDKDGTDTATFKGGKPGSYKVLAKSTDEQGNTIVSATYVYVDGSSGSWAPDQGDFKVTPDRKQYLPGESAKVLIQTSKIGGSALVTVEADRVMWQKVVPLTDNSTTLELPIDGEFAPNANISATYICEKKFFSDSKRIRVDRPDRLLSVTVTPSKAAYEPGDQVELAVETKDEKGRPMPAEVSVGVVDESIYAIRSDDTDIVKGLYPARYNQVDTAYSFPEVYLDGGDKGGNIPLRTKLKDTAFWQPAVQTDQSGRASVSFKLPDNLTEWRATVVGVTDQSVAGQSTTQFKARKDLMVRLQPPMYLVRNDRQNMSVIVTNDTGRDQNVNVRVEGLGITLEGKAQQTIRVAAGKPEALSFTLVANQSGEATLTARAWVDGGASDGVEQKLNVTPYGRPVVEEKAGETSSTANETLTLSSGADPNAGALTVSLTPSLAAGMIQTLPSLVDFPYGCTEQTMSRFMPSMVVASTMRTLGLQLPDVTAKLPKVADESYARLAKMQHGDGGWGWWEYDETNAFMTALVLDGVDRARRAGFAPKYIKLDKAIESAKVLIAKPPASNSYARKEWERNKFYLAYALAKHGSRTPAEQALKGISMKKLGASELAFVTLTAHELGNEALTASALEQLRQVAQEGSTTASWAPQEYAWGAEPTALALTAFATIRPDDEIVAKAVRYLMLLRKTNGWTSTRDTSYSLVGLSTYLGWNKEQLGNTARVRVSVNGQVAKEVDLTLNNPQTIRIPVKELNPGANTMRIETQGGKAFYTVRLEQFDTTADMSAQAGKGLRIKREYFALEPQRTEDGSMKLLPSKTPITSIKSGELVRVVLTIHSDVERQYIMLEDPLPSNCRAQERGELGLYEEWGWWWSKTVLRDDRITFFSTWLSSGENQISYTMRAESPGTSIALPTRVENMYDPSQSATGSALKLEVVR